MSNILLIEPDTILARAYTMAMELEGHTVAHAFTAQGAIYLADEVKPDLVILELQLAAHSGIEFLHEFRSYSEWTRIPIIVNTYMQSSVLDKAKKTLENDLGVSIYLYKPRTTLTMLLKAVKRQVIAA